MALKLTNFVATTLASGINGSQTTIAVSSVAGWPSITTPITDYFYIVVIRGSDNAREIMKVTNYTGTSATVVRAQESTTGLAFIAGDAVGIRFTAQTIIDLIAEEAAARAAAVIAEAQFGALTIPGSAIKDTAIIARHITPAIIDETHLAASVAGAALDGGAGTPLAVKYDGTSVSLNGSGQLTVTPGSLTGAYTAYGKLTAYQGYYVGGTGTGQFYTGTRPFTTYGNAGSGARLVMVQIQNDHATQVAQIGIRIGGTLGHYEMTDSDTGVLVVNAFRIDDTTTRGTFSKAMSFSFFVPPGHHWMFENQTSGTGTPNLVYHNYIELQ